MSELQDMLRVQARLHRKQGANALGDLFQSAALEIEILTERLENPQGLQELICVEQMKEISLPEIHRANQKLHEQLAKANEAHKELFSAFESCQDELKKQIANAKNQNQQLLTYLEDAHAHIGHLACHLAGRVGETARFEMAKRADEWREYCEQLRKEQASE